MVILNRYSTLRSGSLKSQEKSSEKLNIDMSRRDHDGLNILICCMQKILKRGLSM